LEAEAKNYTFQYFENTTEFIAVRDFSMKVLGKLYSKYSKIKEELKTLVEMNLEQNPSPGIVNCGNKMLKNLKLKILCRQRLGFNFNNFPFFVTKRRFGNNF
jgi:hypothetical protein